MRLVFNATFINSKDPHIQFENDKTPETEYLSENDAKDVATNKVSAILNFISKKLSDDKISEGINSKIKSRRKSLMWLINKLR